MSAASSLPPSDGTPARVANCSTLVGATADAVTVLFSADAGPGLYLAYFMPFKTCEYNGGSCQYDAEVSYDSPSSCTAPATWPSQRSAVVVQATAEPLPEGSSPYNQYNTHELRATQAEIAAMPKFDLGHIVAADSFANVTPAANGVPMAWVARSSSDRQSYRAVLAPNEHHTFQISVAATTQPLLVRSYAAPGLPSGWQLNCFNLEGIDAWGNPWQPTTPPLVQVNRTLPLWFGKKVAWCELWSESDGRTHFALQPLLSTTPPGLIVPSNATSGTVTQFSVTVTLTTVGGQTPHSFAVNVTITVSGAVLPDGGDGDLWRGTRLHWINGNDARTGPLPAPYGPLRVDPVSRMLYASFVTVQLAPSGLPLQITTNATGVALPALSPSGVTVALGLPIQPNSCQLTFVAVSTVSASWQAQCAAPAMVINGSMDFTGFLDYHIHAVAPKPAAPLQLRWQASSSAAVFGMGFGSQASTLGTLGGTMLPDWLVLDFGTPRAFDGVGGEGGWKKWKEMGAENVIGNLCLCPTSPF